MDKQSLIVYFLSLLIMTTALKIKDILVPDIKFLNSDKSVILDCDFDAGNDTKDLVVKWFHEDNVIYQWIMGHEPQEVGPFKGKLDLSYKATDNKISMHRALKIKELTVDLAGEYKCVVFNFVDEDSMSKKMLVIDGPKKVEMLQLDAEDDSISITCSVYSVFPKPSLNITYTGSNYFDDIDNQAIQNDNGLYNVTQIVTMSAKELEDSSEFICELDFPDTNFTIYKTLSFIPDNAAVLTPTWIILLTTLSTLLATLLST